MLKKKLKKGGAWLLTVCMLLGSVQLPALEAQAADGDNIALSATATASDWETNDYTAVKVNDGIIDRGVQLGSRWASDTSAGAKWLQLAWDEAQTMKSFVIEWERRNPTDYAIAVSDNGTEWNNVWSSTTAPSDFRQEITLDETVTGKYVRLNINSYDANSEGITWNTVSVFEFEVYEGALPDTRTDLEKIMADITAPTVAAGDTKIAMPQVPDGYTVEFQADYEQVIGSDGTIYAPLQTKTVKGFYEVSDGTESAQSAEFTIEVPGRYTDGADANAKPDVIPALQEWHGETGNFAITDSSKIVYGDGLEDTASQFAADYKDITGKEIQAVKGTADDAAAGDFYLTLGSSDQGLGKEGYIITISDSAAVEALDATGAYWGVISILQILKQNETTIPKGIIRDYPKYEVRGFMLDVGRKSFELDTVKEFAKNLAWYKMNNFHLHLSDNLIFLEDYETMEEAIENAYSGFRLESSLKNDEGVSLTSTDVYYTKDEFRSFIKDSRKIGVSIIPEFDMPAHALGITRVFQEYMTKVLGGSHKYLIEELDVTNPEAIELAKSIWNDYFTGDDPVFDEETTVHIGTDEFHGQGGNEAFRNFSNEMIEFVQGTGRTVRMWGSLSNKSGTTPVASKDVQLNIWSTGYANPTSMYNLGYDMINTLDGYLYIVPSAGYYSDYLNAQYLYNSWVPNNFGGTTFKAGDDQILGGTYAIWNDQIDTRANGISEYDVFDRFIQPLPSLSEKMWGEGTDRTYAEMSEVASEVSTAPNTNPYHKVASESETVMNYTFDEDTMKDSSGNSYDVVDKKNVASAAGKNGNALQLKGGESYVETPVDMVGPTNSISMWVKRDGDSGSEEQILCETSTQFGTYAIKAVQTGTGKVGFSREGYDYSFDYKLPRNRWVYLTINGYKDRAELYVDNEFVSAASMDKETKTTGAITSTLILPVERIGSKTNSFKGLIDDVVVKNAAQQGTQIESYDKVVPQSELTADACTAHSVEGPVGNAIDGDSSTFWHTDWAQPDVITDSHNHWFELTLENPTVLYKLTYLPRQSSANGRILEYNIVVTDEEGNETTVVENGTWADTMDEKEAVFAPIKAKKIKIVLLDAKADSLGKHGTIAELNVYGGFAKEDAQTVFDQYKEINVEGCTGASAQAYTTAYEALRSALENNEDADYTTLAVQFRNAAEGLVKVPDTAWLAELAGREKDTGNYTKASEAAYKTALDAAKAVLADEEATQAEVDAAADALYEAEAALVVYVRPDDSALNSAIEEAKKVTAADYTEASAEAFQSALQAAKDALADARAEEAELESALEALNAAKTALRKNTDDAALKEAAELDLSGYTDDSARAYRLALTNAQRVFQNAASTQADIDEALKTLAEAKGALVIKVERGELTTAIEEAEKLNLDEYTAETAEAFRQALADAKAAASDEGADQAAVDAALKALAEAKDKLVKKPVIVKPDVTKLTSAVADAKKVDLNSYTSESVNAFKAALGKAEAVLADANASQAEVDAALKALADTKAALKKQPTVPAKGTKFTASSGLIYKVTKSDAKNGTVAVVGTAKKKSTVTIPSTVTKDGFTFKVTQIGAKAFQSNKKITKVVIGANITKIGSKSFYKCSKLKKITFKSKKAPKFGSNAFKGIKATATVYVPKKISSKNLQKIKKGMKSAGKKIKYKKK